MYYNRHLRQLKIDQLDVFVMSYLLGYTLAYFYRKRVDNERKYDSNTKLLDKKLVDDLKKLIKNLAN
jgi:hypothetical protein